MSETSQGHGWWKASDGLFYPPETHPDYVPPPPPRGATYQPPVFPPPAAPAPQVTTGLSPPSVPDSGSSEQGRRGHLLLLLAFAVVVLAGAVAVVGLLVTSGTETQPVAVGDYRVDRTAALAPSEAFVTTGAETNDGVVIFGTINDAEATNTQVWSADALTVGPGSEVQVGTLEVPVGIPYLYGVTPTEDGFLGAGEVFFPESGESQAAIFSSPDGLDWSLVAAPGGVGDADAVYDVAVVGDLALAVSVNDTETIGANDVYQSTDGGVTWQPTLVELATNFANLWGIGTDGERFVLVGSTALPGGSEQPVIFISDDGVAWRKAALPLGFAFPGVLYDVTAVDGGFLAVGVEYRESSDDALVFASTDGEGWRDLIGEDKVNPRADEAMYSVVADGPGAVITGLIDDRYGFWEVTVVEQ